MEGFRRGSSKLARSHESWCLGKNRTGQSSVGSIAYRLSSYAGSRPSCRVALALVAGRERVVDWTVAFASPARCEVAETT